MKESLGVDDSTLRDLAFHCKILEELSLAGCCLVTNKGISHVAEVDAFAWLSCCEML